MEKWIRMLTCSRLLFGAGAAVLWAFGRFEAGAWIFVIGLFTKAADTYLADRTGCPILADDNLYRWVAIMFNMMATVGLTVGMFNAAMAHKISWWLAIMPFFLTGNLMLISSFFVRPHSKIAKVRSGAVSAILALCLAPLTSPLVLLMASFWIGSGECYKLYVYETAETR